MPLEVTCHCGMFMRVKDELAGRTVNCPQCQDLLTIPVPDPEPVLVAELVPEPMTVDEFEPELTEVASDPCPMCGTPVTIIARQCPDCGEPLQGKHHRALPPPIDLDRKLLQQICGEFRAIGMFWVFLGFISLVMSITGYATLSERLERVLPFVPLLLGLLLVLSWGMLITGIITLARELMGLYVGLVQSYIFLGLLAGPVVVLFDSSSDHPVLIPISMTLVVLFFIIIQAHLTIRLGRRLKQQGVNLKKIQE